ncbi:MAG: RNA polymerase-associated protein rapA, partial [Gammaproteobacteria bacterium]|nr:RNA polymerase-associated protein rapA [Gammaproteobacteria bacterium]
EADYFKYVLGVDVTVLTNLLVSTQFIQFRNLDYVNQPDNCPTQGGRTVDCSRYTADFATLHLSNGLNKAEKNKEFYSLFLSKPFGENQLGRVNNIIIYEENGGWWDRLDAEYSLTDQVVLTGELNFYWGDENTTFGQFKDSSSVQVGMKYIIE